MPGFMLRQSLSCSHNWLCYSIKKEEEASMADLSVTIDGVKSVSYTHLDVYKRQEQR